MPYESLPPKTERAHSVNIEGREKMKIQGVDDVSGFDENMVVLCSSQGDITVRGQGLHIERIDLDAGCLELHGHIQELSYDEPAPSGGFWSKLFGGGGGEHRRAGLRAPDRAWRGLASGAAVRSAAPAAETHRERTCRAAGHTVLCRGGVGGFPVCDECRQRTARLLGAAGGAVRIFAVPVHAKPRF